MTINGLAQIATLFWSSDRARQVARLVHGAGVRRSIRAASIGCWVRLSACSIAFVACVPMRKWTGRPMPLRSCCSTGRGSSRCMGYNGCRSICRLTHSISAASPPIPRSIPPRVSHEYQLASRMAAKSTMSYLTQMLGLTVQNFVSAATGMAVLVALIRGLSWSTSRTLGNFWIDLVRGTLYILLPLALMLAILLVSQGVVQTVASYHRATPLQQGKPDTTPATALEQILAVGPAASQVAIKQLGTNGGGFFNVNSAHPFENPTPLSNFIEVLAILLIPAALCYTFGVMVGDTRQGWALLAAMTILLLCFVPLGLWAEQSGNPILTHAGVNQQAQVDQAGGNMEGKETRFGITGSVLWSAVTTAASNGAVNSMHDSYTPLGGLVPMILMQFGEVVFGGVGSGLYGMIVFAIIAVFVAGLMVGRTPEYLGKKIEPYDMKMAALLILIMPIVVLGFTALAISTESGTVIHLESKSSRVQ